MKWTEEQEDILRDHAHQGVEAVLEELALIGVYRSASSVQRHGSRIGITFTKYETCPLCGSPTSKLKRSGLCPTCHIRLLAQKSRERRKEIKAQIKECEQGERYKEARTEWNRERQRNLRRKKIGYEDSM